MDNPFFTLPGSEFLGYSIDLLKIEYFRILSPREWVNNEEVPEWITEKWGIRLFFD
jgi:hypothetical protein